jgi:L-fuculose-phosphate aldolase
LKTSEARGAVAAAYRDLGRRGLIVGSSGNVSVRTRKGMAITPSGGDPDRAGPDDMAAASLDGVQSGDATPSSEWSMHAAIYKMKPDALCIVHAHADACTALASLHEGLPPFHYMVLHFGGSDIRCAPYVTFGTKALADLAADALIDRTACLLANHGMILHARSAAAAVSDAVLLETLCRQYLLARSAGTPRLLTDEDIAAARERFRTYGPQPTRR